LFSKIFFFEYILLNLRYYSIGYNHYNQPNLFLLTMQLRHLSSLLLLTFGVATLSAVNVTLTPGSLSSLVSEPSTVTDLKLSGSMNVEDFKFINESMTALQSLDLSDVQIAEYSGQTQSGRTVSAAATIPFGALAGSNIQSVKLPTTGLSTIEECAFAASQLHSIELPASAVTIGDGAFAACPELKEVTFKAATQLPTAAFKDCTALQTVNGSDLVTAIGDYAFDGCSALSSFGFGKSLTTIGTSAFQRSALANADMSQCSALTTVGAWAFANDSALQRVEFNKSVATLGEGLFFDCAELQTVVLPEACCALPDYAFTNNTKLSQADIADLSINQIGRYALKGVSMMATIVLPYTLNAIDDNAMEGMTGLKEIDATALYDVPELGNDVWHGVDQSQVLVKANESVLADFKATPQWQDFKYDEPENAVDDITASLTPSLKGCFIGTTLVVKAENIQVNKLSLYNIAGTLLATITDRSETAEFETAAYSDIIYIVVATLPDNRTASLKIAR
jgi:hypothetical protein